MIDGVGVEADQGLSVAVDAEDLKEGDQEVKSDLFSGSGPCGQSLDNMPLSELKLILVLSCFRKFICII